MKSSVPGKAAVTALAGAGSPSLRAVGSIPEQLSIELIQARAALRLPKDQGWPDQLSLKQVACLQAMGQTANPGDFSRIANEWEQFLDQAVSNGVLLAEKVVEEVLIQKAGTNMVTIDPFSGRRRVEDVDAYYKQRRNGRAGMGRTESTPIAVERPAKYGTRTHVLFRPADLANLFHLHSDAISPQRHLVAWIRATGAQWPLESVSPAEKNADQVHQHGAIERADSLEPVDWASLVKFRKANPGTPWTDDMRRLLVAEKDARDRRPGAKGVANTMAAELEISVTSLNRTMGGLGQPGSRELKRRKRSAS